jgi:hypothetical protein
MAKYLVTYDLVGTNEGSSDYKRLIDAIKTYPTWGRVQDSVWLIKSGLASEQIFDHLWQYMDANDRLLVVRLGGGITWINERCKRSWMNNFVNTP